MQSVDPWDVSPSFQTVLSTASRASPGTGACRSPPKNLSKPVDLVRYAEYTPTYARCQGKIPPFSLCSRRKTGSFRVEIRNFHPSRRKRSAGVRTVLHTTECLLSQEHHGKQAG